MRGCALGQVGVQGGAAVEPCCFFDSVGGGAGFEDMEDDELDCSSRQVGQQAPSDRTIDPLIHVPESEQHIVRSPATTGTL